MSLNEQIIMRFISIDEIKIIPHILSLFGVGIEFVESARKSFRMFDFSEAVWE